MQHRLECLWLLVDLSSQSTPKLLRALLSLLASLTQQPSPTTNNMLFSLGNHLRQDATQAKLKADSKIMS